jgi:Putative transposase/Transposase zinc-binding domain
VNPHRLEVADVFRQHEQEFLQRWGSVLSPQQLRVFRDICACQTAALGTRIERCDNCSLQIEAFNSCRNRHCPKCQSAAREKWLVSQSRDLLPVPYCHVVFTLPHDLAVLALQNPKTIYGILFRAVSETLLTIAADPRLLGAQIGVLAVLHTWNQQLLAHPHVHCVIPAGGIGPNESRWIPSRKRFFLPLKVLRRMFRGKFLAFLTAAFHKRKLRFWGTIQQLRNPTEFHRLVRQLRSRNWVVYARRPFHGPEHVIQYLARYTHRVAISNGRLISLQNGQVTFRWRDSADGNRQKLMTIDAVEFIRRFLLHVLPRGFVKIRHFGFLANRNRREALALCRTLLPCQQNASPDLQSAASERKCPVCKVGSLRVVERIPAAASIHRVLALANFNTS